MTKASSRLFIFAGEKSGDLHGSYLVKALKTLCPSILIEGVAGPKMRDSGVIDGVVNGIRMENFEVMGFSDVICALPRLCRYFYQVRNYILLKQPQAVVLIDYPGFNLRLAKALRKKGYKGKIIQYVSPSVWAWGKHRIEGMANTLDLLLTIYPFEAECFAGTHLKVEYVGNPLCEYIKEYQYHRDWKQSVGISSTASLVALFPGSRRGEIERNLPLLLETAALIKQRYPDIVFGISCVDSSLMSQAGFDESFVSVPREYTYELIRDSRTAIAKGGTITLELALQGCPTAVFYKVTRLNRFYAKYILKVRLAYFCIVNIIANKEVFPELIVREVTPSCLAADFFRLHVDGEERARCLAGCHDVRELLEGHDSSIAAATAIKMEIECVSV